MPLSTTNSRKQSFLHNNNNNSNNDDDDDDDDNDNNNNNNNNHNDNDAHGAVTIWHSHCKSSLDKC